MSYRDDNDALVARNHALDEELRETRAELEALREREASAPESEPDAPDREEGSATEEPSDARAIFPLGLLCVAAATATLAVLAV